MDETLPPQKPLRGQTQERQESPAGGDFRTLGESRPEDETRELEIGDAAAASPGVERLGRYAIEAKIGEGGMGKVYRCYDPTLKRRVAVKVLHDKFVRDERYKARFLREAQTVAGLSHPAVAQVYSIETAGGSLSIVMEYVPGKSLEELLEAQHQLSTGDAAEFIRQATDGLRAAHARGIIHRDIKPSNILVDEEGRVKLVDFGLAKELGTKSSLTDEGIVMGTPQYISPEQGRGAKVDQRSDIYSLGATFYHLITGRPPFENKSQIAMIVAHVQDTPPAPQAIRKDVPTDVSTVIGRMMATDPGDRYQDYDELADDIDVLLGRRRSLHSANSRGRFSREVSRSWRRPILIAAALLPFLIGAVVLGIVPGIPGISGLVGRERIDLKQWSIRTPDGGDVILLDFASPPPDAPELLEEVLSIPAPTSPTASAPSIVDGALRWTDYSQPFACSFVFEEIKQISLYVKEHTGSFDFGVSIVHPDGVIRRSLSLLLRPGSKRAEPLGARRNGNEASFSPALRPLPRLVPPYRVFLSFTRNGETTDVLLTVTRPMGERTETTYEETYTLDGNHWNSGVVVFKSSSSRHLPPYYRIALDKVVLFGTLTGKRITRVPWQS
ncbi:MAG: serine/threonine-protein kinase [Planctomycetota bacterium]|nr:serine/threonine-protein kinase [Planctomycetota bacterium]